MLTRMLAKAQVCVAPELSECLPLQQSAEEHNPHRFRTETGFKAMCRSSREVLSLLRFFVPKELQYLTYLHLEAENLGRKINEQFDPSNDYYTFLS